MEITKGHSNNQKGSALLITTILLLILTVMIGTCFTVSGMQYDLALLNRNTSQTYHLAHSAILKQVDTINKSLDMEMTNIIKTLDAIYIQELVNEGTSIRYSDDKLSVEDTILRTKLEECIFDYIMDNFSKKAATVYKVQADRESDAYTTTVSVKISDQDSENHKLKNALRLIATATTKNTSTLAVYDTQKVEAIIGLEIPDTFTNQIHEQYAFREGEIPDVLRSALLCFSDVVVSETGKLEVTKGDVRVGGPQKISNYGTEEKPLYAEANQHGGIIALNGGQIKIADNLYCTNNVLVTNGWHATSYDAESSIEVGKDVIAYTLGIVDDYYHDSTNQSPFNTDHQVSQATIDVKRNVMVDNDVMIGRWVNKCQINVGQTIFGINGGSDLNVDPNQSSGVFSQGDETIITADRMFVAGQPYITMEASNKPLKLWESIGEPFDGLASYEGYKADENVEKPTNKDYLTVFQSLIQGDKIKTDFTNTYAVASVSGIDLGDSNKQKVGVACKAIFGINQVDAVRFFYKGGSSDDFRTFMKDPDTTYTNKVQDIMSHIGDYYQGTESGYQRNISNQAPDENYKGLRGYMTLMRSIFYRGFDTSGSLVKATFKDIIRTEERDRDQEGWDLPENDTTSNQESWQYATPICVTNGGTIDVSQFYVKEGTDPYRAYPSIIISNNGADTKTLKLIASESEHHTFKGIIISRGSVEIESDINLEGVLIIGGPESMPALESGDRSDIFKGTHAGLKLSEHTLTLTYNQNILTDMVVKDYTLYRKILDALYLTNYKDQTILEEIVDKQEANNKKLLTYTDASTLEVDVEGVGLKIKSLKQTR